MSYSYGESRVLWQAISSPFVEFESGPLALELPETKLVLTAAMEGGTKEEGISMELLLLPTNELTAELLLLFWRVRRCTSFDSRTSEVSPEGGVDGSEGERAEGDVVI